MTDRVWVAINLAPGKGAPIGTLVRAFLRRKAPSSSIDAVEQINDIMEADSMLAKRTEGWFDEAERKGLQQGLEKGLEAGIS